MRWQNEIITRINYLHGGGKISDLDSAAQKLNLPLLDPHAINVPLAEVVAHAVPPPAPIAVAPKNGALSYPPYGEQYYDQADYRLALFLEKFR